MQVMDTPTQTRPASLVTPVRNRYYFGKLLDVVHFDIEQDYFNSKRWLINRAVLGYGVVCGLDVQLRSGNASVVVTPGFALDKWGREIIAPSESRTMDLPPPPAPKAPAGSMGPTPPSDGCEDGDCYYSLYICYYECAASPEPGIGDDCGQQSCTPSLIQERYKLEWRKGKAPDPPADDCGPSLWTGDKVNRKALAMRITDCCPDFSCDPCLPLANVRLPKADGSSPADVDITIRPIVYTNDLLFELLNSRNSDPKSLARGGK
jgi:hypothetical protein